MNYNKILAYGFSGLTVLAGVLDRISPILPPQWQALVVAVLGVLAFYHIGQSHTAASLAKSGFYRV